MKEYQLKFPPTVNCFDYICSSSSSTRSISDTRKKATKWMSKFDNYVNDVDCDGECVPIANELGYILMSKLCHKWKILVV